MRFAAVNIGGLALLATIWREGWIDQLLIADSTGLVRLIAAIFLLGLGWCVVRIVEIGSEMNAMRAERPDPSSESGRFLDKLRKRAAAAGARPWREPCACALPARSRPCAISPRRW